MQYIPNILFLIIVVVGVGFFIKNCKKIIRNINLGQKIDPIDQKKTRWNNVLRIAFGQSKMVARPLSGFLHIIVYVGFIIINIEVLEIIIDGLFGTHRIFSGLGVFYDILIGSFEVLALLVLLSVILFWIRRNFKKIKRFWSPEMEGWPKNDANIILYFEMILMSLFLLMNVTDYQLQLLGSDHYNLAGSFPVSSYLLTNI
jgi:hypothetical protein